MPSELFDTVPGFDWKHIKSDASTRYTDVYRNTLLTTLTRNEETKQKCFIVVAEGTTSYGPRNHIYIAYFQQLSYIICQTLVFRTGIQLPSIDLGFMDLNTLKHIKFLKVDPCMNYSQSFNPLSQNLL